MSAEPVRARALPDGEGVVVTDAPAIARVEWRGAEHAILAQASDGRGSTEWLRTRLVIGPARRPTGAGVLLREVLIDGWLVDVELEPERRAALRDRARRARPEAQGSGDGQSAVELRADLPGRIAGLFVAPGDAVTAGQPLLVIEAMKMLNELRAPRAALVEVVAVAVGRGVELGDLLVRLR